MIVGTSSLRDWEVTKDAGSTITYSNDNAAVCSSPDNATRCFFFKRLSARVGETITVKFRAKSDVGTLMAGIDYPSIGNLVVQRAISNKSWQDYELSYTVPDTQTSATSYVNIVIGHITGYLGTFRIANVQISIDNSELSSTRIHGMALFSINTAGNGSVIVNNSFSCVGVARDFTATITNTLTLQLRPMVGGNEARSAPLFYADVTPDNTLALKVICKIGQYNRTTGQVTIKFIDVTTGGLIDISSLGAMYVNFFALGA